MMGLLFVAHGVLKVLPQVLTHRVERRLSQRPAIEDNGSITNPGHYAGADPYLHLANWDTPENQL